MEIVNAAQYPRRATGRVTRVFTGAVPGLVTDKSSRWAKLGRTQFPAGGTAQRGTAQHSFNQQQAR